MSLLQQHPAPGSYIRACSGDILSITLVLKEEVAGTACLRTNIGRSAERRAEIIASAKEGRKSLAVDWHDIPMRQVSPVRFEIRLPLVEPGVFEAKACFISGENSSPDWPDGRNLTVKVAPAGNRAGNSVYTAFVRQFGTTLTMERSPGEPDCLIPLEEQGFANIPPSGTFRDLIARLDVILGEMCFRNLQLLPIHPVPTTFARMGRYGSPFAGQDFFAVDPALAQFDRSATPMEQFKELLDVTHSYGARLFLDLPANHTGWASVLQNHHPEWFLRGEDGEFVSPGAWGVVWEDLVELDYKHRGLREFMASVFEFWCREGVDGFRCDAGYMIPVDVWMEIVARVRMSFPDTVFLLEGLGGKLSVTRELLETANLDWAYSEVFQTEDRADFESYFPAAAKLSVEAGPLIHFAETHDNLRLAARSQLHAVMRVQLSALLSEQGTFGITNGVEWFADEKVNVHGSSALRWGASPNMKSELRRLNLLLASHPAFDAGAEISLIQVRNGNTLAILRRSKNGGKSLLILVNLDDSHPQPVNWSREVFEPTVNCVDLLGGTLPQFDYDEGTLRSILAPAQVVCISNFERELKRLQKQLAENAPREAATVREQRLREVVLRIRQVNRTDEPLREDEDTEAMVAAFVDDPQGFLEEMSRVDKDGYPHLMVWRWPEDAGRSAPVPPRHFVLFEAASPFSLTLQKECGKPHLKAESIEIRSGYHVAVLPPLPVGQTPQLFALQFVLYAAEGIIRHRGELMALPPAGNFNICYRYGDAAVRGNDLAILLSNGRGAMLHVPARWAELRSRYDSLLAANPDPLVPCDRQMLFARCRVWVRYRGYSQEVDAGCQEEVLVDIAENAALWRFRVPVGLGRWIPLELRLQLIRDSNSLQFDISRSEAPGSHRDMLPDYEAVEIVLRPDIESRSFHDTVKAYLGAETAWRDACSVEQQAVQFTPPGRPGLHLSCDAGAYIHQPEWHYMVPRPLEQERGLEAVSDLFSPGYFKIKIGGNETARLSARMATEKEPPIQPMAASDQPFAAERSFADGLQMALKQFLAARDEGQTIIAGYPWFLDWGRDTLIVARGMIAAGMLKETLEILREFARFEKGGTLPNMIRGNDDSNRDTSDAPLWFAVATRELAQQMPDGTVMGTDCGGRTLAEVIHSIGLGYRHGTGNGIIMDPETALVYSPSHYTWMDTNHPAGSPRQGYPVEIQALWIATLHFLSEIYPQEDWGMLAELARSSLHDLFWLEDNGFLADCLHCDTFRPAGEAQADDHLRCNQLFALTLGAFTDKTAGRRILRACESLLVPGAIRSLADRPVSLPLPVRWGERLLNDPQNPYWGRYEGDEDIRRKPAYHNGTAWVWPFPAFAEALVGIYGNSAGPSAMALLESCRTLFDDGAIGHLPEIVDGNTPHRQRGCTGQAWSVSEILRVWKRVKGQGAW